MRKNYFFLSIYWILKCFNDTFTTNDTDYYEVDNWLQRVFYPKWVLGMCRHLCSKCDYKDECFENIEGE